MSVARVAGLDELLAEHGPASYREVLRVPALSLGLFAAAPGHDDVQSPHKVDEVYVVVAGRPPARSRPGIVRRPVIGKRGQRHERMPRGPERRAATVARSPGGC
ncbi:MAG: hypothetical protein ACR2K2_02430 [Mycobacteriales bacterium]